MIDRTDDCFDGLIDHGARPYVENMLKATMNNDCYRTTLWTGERLQTTIMKIEAGDDTGLEMHDRADQFIMIICGVGVVTFGESRDVITKKVPVKTGYGIFIPAGMWHNVINCGIGALKMFSVYAPPEHLRGTVHPTKAIAKKEEE